MPTFVSPLPALFFLVLFHGSAYSWVRVKCAKSFLVIWCFLQSHCLNLSEEGSHTRHITKNDVCEAEAAVSHSSRIVQRWFSAKLWAMGTALVNQVVTMAFYSIVSCTVIIISLAAICLLCTMPTECFMTRETAFEGICYLSKWLIKAKTLHRISTNAHK